MWLIEIGCLTKVNNRLKLSTNYITHWFLGKFNKNCKIENDWHWWIPNRFLSNLRRIDWPGYTWRSYNMPCMQEPSSIRIVHRYDNINSLKAEIEQRVAAQVWVSDSEAEEREVKNDDKVKMSKMWSPRDEVSRDPDQIGRRGKHCVLRMREVWVHLLS